MKHFNIILAILFATQSAFAAVIGDDAVSVGKQGSTANKSVRFGAGSTAVKPQIRYNVSGGALEFSNNGTDFSKMGSGGGGGGGVNMLQDFNSDAESGTTGWTASGGTFASSTSSPFNGTRSFTWTASALSQTLYSAAPATPVGFNGRKCQVHVPFYTYTGTAGDYNLRVVDGSANVLVDFPVPQTTSPATAPLFIAFDCPASPVTLKSGFISMVASPGALKFDDVFQGQGRSVIVGGAYLSAWKQYTPIITGATSFTNVNVWSRRVGENLEVQGYFTVNTPTAVTAAMSLGFDGINGGVFAANRITSNQHFGTWNSNSFGQAAASPMVAGGGSGTMAFGIANGAIGNAHQTNNGSAIWAAVNAISVNFTVPIQGWTADRLPVEGNLTETLAWRVDAILTGANFDLGTSQVSSYAAMGNPTITLTNNPTSTMTALVPCTAGTAPTGTTCGGGASENNGIAWVQPVAGTAKVCAQFAWVGNIGSGHTDNVFQIVETTAASDTPLQGGTSNLQGGVNAGTNVLPFTICENMKFSPGLKIVKLRFVQLIQSGTVVSSSILSDGAPGAGNRSVKWSVEPIDQQTPAPNFTEVKNKVSSSSSNERTERISFAESTNETTECASGTCTIYSQSGGFTNVSRTSAGLYKVNVPAGIWSTVPTCVCSGSGSSSARMCNMFRSLSTTTQFDVRAYSAGATPADALISMICTGQK